MKRQTLLVSFLLVAAMASGIIGCQNIVPRGKFEPVHAQVRRMFDAQANPILNSHGDFSSQTLEIDKPEQVRKLAAYFPGLGEENRERHPSNKSYTPSVQIVFTSADRRTITVNTDYVTWNDGHGDRRVGSGFVRFIDQLFTDME